MSVIIRSLSTRQAVPLFIREKFGIKLNPVINLSGERYYIRPRVLGCLGGLYGILWTPSNSGPNSWIINCYKAKHYAFCYEIAKALSTELKVNVVIEKHYLE